MSIVLSSSSKGRSVQSAAFFTVSYTPPYFNTDGWPYTVHYQDMLLNSLAGSYFYCPGPFCSISRLFGYSLDDDAIRIIHSRKPSPPNINDGHDAAAYANLTHNLQVFGSVLTGQSFTAPSTGGENEIRHTNFSGTLSTSQTFTPTFAESFDFFGYAIACRNFHGQLIDYCRLLSTEPLEFDLLLRDHPGIPTYCVLDLLDDLSMHCSDYTAEAYGIAGTRHITDLSYAISDSGLRITYGMYAYNAVVDISYRWDSEILIPFRYPESLNGASLGTWVPVWNSVTSCKFSFSNCTESSPPPPGSLPEILFEDEFYGGYLSPFPISMPSVLDVEEGVGFSGPSLRSNIDRIADNFRSAIDYQYVDLTASALFSTVDAYKQAEGYLGTNILQNLAKIPDIASAFPQIREGVSVMSRILRRDLSLSTLRELLDLATSTNLQANFQWRPFISVFTEYIPLMISTFSTLGLPPSRTIGRGSFSKTLSNVLGRESVTVVARTKIVMDSSPSGLLSAILAVDALGALPKVSNLWDLVPFSFAANWFTGIGESIRRAEYSLLLATIPAYFVHSFKVTSPFTDRELSDLGAASSSSQRALLSVYFRDVSLYCPLPRDSSFGFGIPSELPPTGVLASLLYQLIFG
jgi:hypothetical protein